MEKINDGGSAYPMPFFAAAYNVGESVLTVPDPKDFQQGMSLRDWFAGMALQGIIADSGWEPIEREEGIMPVSEVAYRLADAMLTARQPTLDQ